MNSLLSYLLFFTLIVTVTGQGGFYGNPFAGYGGYGYGQYGGPYGRGYGGFGGFLPYGGNPYIGGFGPYGRGYGGFASGLFDPRGGFLGNALRGAAAGALYGAFGK
ncbi:hypothetical protein KIN20_011970 [Parelaphostrongylus tenuis]|uniref:Uncharacterized protein n=1 Tax=Parelaphostrongylus tenuis TaxID=148309 RepID=A0AAD5MA72_PARTN|nr:hypothetical protein KIN20_011970 [Parelaphostrongylus tenuis]